MWDDRRLEWFSRELLVRELDFAGTERLLAATAEVGGAGPGPDWLARYLAAAGPAVARVADPDRLSWNRARYHIEMDGAGAWWLVRGPGRTEWPGSSAAALRVAALTAALAIKWIGAGERPAEGAETRWRLA